MIISDELYASGKVRRWHTHPSLQQSVADHSWGVAVILSIINPEASKSLLIEALVHDCHELYSGDIPSPAKNSQLRQWEGQLESDFRQRNNLPAPCLSEDDQRWLKLADLLEAKMFLAMNDSRDRAVQAASERLDKMIERQERLLNVNNTIEQLQFLFGGAHD